MVYGITFLCPVFFSVAWCPLSTQSRYSQILYRLGSVHVARLFPNTVIIFGFVVDDIKEESPLTPQALKVVLCITPLLLLLLVNTAKDSYSSGNKELQLWLQSYLSRWL